MNQTLVMKFGGASVATADRFSQIADIIISKHQQFSKIAIVMSAMGETTNQLIELAKQVNQNPPQREYDMLISVGERISMSLLAMALCKKGKEAISFTGSQSGIITCQNHANACIVDVKPYRLAECLNSGKIVIVAGFQGVSREKEITTLGRGGSDTTAVALGLALNADKVEFYKDVGGVYDADPKKNASAVQHSHLTYVQALDIVKKGAKVLHQRAIELAAKNGLLLHVKSFCPSLHTNEGTLIYDVTVPKRQTPLYEEEG